MANAITLTSGMRKNLFSLQNTEKLLQTTQTRLATGLRVQKAVDDPINYFTALEHRQRAGDLSTTKRRNVRIDPTGQRRQRWC
jgi:flagellin